MSEEAKKEETPEQPKKSKKMLFILIAVAVIGIGGGAAAFFAMGGKEEPASEAAAATPAAPANAKAALVPLDTFLVNLSDASGDRFMKVTMQLAIAPESVADDLDDDDLMRARVRDRILTVLMSKSFQELSNPLGKESLRHEIQAQAGPILESGEIRDVLFSEFVVQ